MTDPGFKVESTHRDEPFRSRTTFRGYYQFCGEAGAVVVEPETARQLSAAAAKALPDETGGLLSGRTLRDEAGSYVLVSGHIEAASGAGRKQAFWISPQATDQLRRKLSLRYPTADVVGWWHSHRCYSPYSSVDFSTQRMWAHRHSVGLLVFADRKPWARAYLGPQASDLGGPSQAIPQGDGDVPGSADRTGAGRSAPERPGDQPDQHVLVIPDPPQEPAALSVAQQRGLVRLVAIMGVILILLMILSLVGVYFLSGLSSRLTGLSSQVTTERRTLIGEMRTGNSLLTQQVRRDLAKPPRPSISIYCAAAQPSAPNDLSCTAKASVSAAKVEWLLDGSVVAEGSNAEVRVPLDSKPHQIGAIVMTRAGNARAVPLRVGPSLPGKVAT